MLGIEKSLEAFNDWKSLSIHFDFVESAEYLNTLSGDNLGRVDT